MAETMATLAVSLCLIYGVVIGFNKVTGIFFIYLQNDFGSTMSEISFALSMSSVVMFIGVSLCFTYGMVLAFSKLMGIFFLHLQDSFNATISEISLAISLSFAVMFLGGPFYAAFFKTCGAQRSLLLGGLLISSSYILMFVVYSKVGLYIVFGVMTGLGSGLAYISAITMASQAFTKSRAMILNLMQTTYLLLSTILAKLTQLAITFYGWRPVCTLDGAILLNLIPLAMLAHTSFNRRKGTQIIDEKPTQNENKTYMEMIKDAFDLLLLKDVCFLAFSFSSACLNTSRHMAPMYLARLAQYYEISDDQAATLLSCYFLADFPCCLILGILSNVYNERLSRGGFFLRNKATSILLVVPLFQAAAFLIPVFSSEYKYLMIYSILIGICDGVYGGFPMTAVSELFGTDRIAGAMGFRAISLGIFSVLVPSLTGHLIDVYGTFDVVQYMCIVLLLLSVFVMAIVLYAVKRRNDKLSNTKLKS